MAKARREGQQEVERLGGDMHAIIASLEEKSAATHGWKYHLKLDEEGVVTGIWWQSPLQGELCRRYSDILINDDTYNRNRSGYPLDIGITIDGHGIVGSCGAISRARVFRQPSLYLIETGLSLQLSARSL